MVKLANRLIEKKPAAPAATPEDVLRLGEIRDERKKRPEPTTHGTNGWAWLLTPAGFPRSAPPAGRAKSPAHCRQGRRYRPNSPPARPSLRGLSAGYPPPPRARPAGRCLRGWRRPPPDGRSARADDPSAPAAGSAR